MKMTFTETDKLNGSKCHRCGGAISGLAWFNYNPRSQIKRLCGTCYSGEQMKNYTGRVMFGNRKV